jgi:multidrug resistance efflux pump
VKVYVSKAIAEVVLLCESQLEATGARASSKIAKLEAEQLSSIRKVQAQVMELHDLMAHMKKERQTLNAAVDEAHADMKLIKERIGFSELSRPRAKLAELHEEDPPAQNIRARRLIKPNKRFYSNEWTR